MRFFKPAELGPEALDAARLVHLAEACGVPQLGAEIAIAFNALFRQFDVART